MTVALVSGSAMYKRLHHRIKRFSLRWRLLPGLLLLVSAASTGAGNTEQLDLLLQEESLPGIAWVIAEDDTITSGGNGLAELGGGKPMSADTKVQVGSVTKVLVALGVLQLVTDGKLALDTEVQQLLPALKWRNPWQPEAPVRVVHLLEHTAGLDNIRMWQFLNSAVKADTPLANAFPHSHEDLLLVRTRPGSQYSYSNMGYALLGMVIERITGERYEDYLARSLLKPLGMRDSSFHLVTQDSDPRLAMGYLDDGVPQPAVPMFLRPAGQFTTTSKDMGQLLQFLLGNGSINGAHLVAPELMARLGTPSTTDAYRAGLSIGHGLALAGRDRHGVLGECHPGTTFGFRAYLCLFRDEGKAFFYAINADDEKADYERFNEYFIHRIGVSQQPAAPVASSEKLDAYTGLYALSPPNMAQFEWLDWMFNSIWLRKDTKAVRLVMRSLQQEERQLVPIGDGLFRDSQRQTASHVFYDKDNQALSNGLMTWRRTSLLSLILGWASLLAGLLGLVYIILRGGWLIIRGEFFSYPSIVLPWLCLAAFAAPIVLFTRQPFLKFGEITAASLSLAVLSGLLPLLLCAALLLSLKRPQRYLPDQLALLASAQLCVVLALQGVLPVMFWK